MTLIDVEYAFQKPSLDYSAFELIFELQNINEY